MLILGVDVGGRNFGYCLIRVDREPEVLLHETRDVGNTRDWRILIPKALDWLRASVSIVGYPDVVAIEELVWYGKRKGVLALAHLAGAVAGYVLGEMDAKSLFFQPRDVKAMSRTYPRPEGFTEHEHDALSLCRLALGKKTNGKEKVVGKLADKPVAPRRTKPPSK